MRVDGSHRGRGVIELWKVGVLIGYNIGICGREYC